MFYHAAMKTRTAALLLSVAAVAAPVSAQVTPWYIGIAAGESRTSDKLVANRESTITNAVSLETDSDSRDLAFKATVGYRFFPWLSVEADYTDLGKHRLVTDALGGNPVLPARLTLEREVSGFGVDAVFMAPVAVQWKVFGRVGAFHAKLDASQGLDGNVVFTGGDATERTRSASQSETVLRWGLGSQFELTDCWWLRLEWTRHEEIGKGFRVGGSGTTGEADTDSVLVGLLFRF
jgi:opacity protein-like surface antigen